MPKWRAKAGRPRRKMGEMNSLERLWSEELETRMRRGSVIRWDYEPVSLRIAWPHDGVRGSSYTPDFMVILEDGEVVFHETKGFMRDDARLKLKVASERYPFRFCLVTRKNGKWKEEWL
jgi:hypothetical protein